MEYSFEVSAKAARVLGRENIADVDGALVELVKNGYDADAKCVYVYFDVPFPDIQQPIAVLDLKNNISDEHYKMIKDKFILSEGNYIIREDLSQQILSQIQKILFSYNAIVIIDNGIGMDLETVQTSWMQIATSGKEHERISPGGRVCTGEKGIGRFALDKLSLSSKMFTSTGESSTIEWSLDWEQFSNVKLLSEVKAEVKVKTVVYREIVKSILGKRYEKVKDYDWDHGTTIILSPVREAWNDRTYEKVNSSLNSINPIEFLDQFDIFVSHTYRTKYNLEPDINKNSKIDYDYKISFLYDGERKLKVELTRNEVNVNKKKIEIEVNEKTKTFNLEDFWRRKAFSNSPYCREDYSNTIIFELDIVKELGESLDRIKSVGAFSGVLYFIKSQNSGKDYEIMKRVKSRSRRQLLDRYSGIKIYRDEFKVRPYGDNVGPMYDWIGLGARQQASPAGAADPNGAWRVLINQLIGNVNIKRDINGNLFDTSNRGGLILNESYYIFLEILKEVLKVFEYDRQYFYREYKKWYDECKKSLKPTDRIIDSVRNRNKNKQEQEGNNNSQDNTNGQNDYEEYYEGEYSREEYEETVADLIEEKEKEMNAKQIMEMLSSSGIIINTFFHELRYISVDFASRAPLLKRCIDYITNEEYEGPKSYNPYPRIEDLNNTDKLLNEWLHVAMDGVQKENLDVKELNFNLEIEKIISNWNGLLKMKNINLKFISCKEQCIISMSIADINIILNNFLLNSAYFLEEDYNDNRLIEIEIMDEAEFLVLRLYNNGPKLSDDYLERPQIIFELGKTTKEQGTGLGLWILREATIRNNGEVFVDTDIEGFQLKVLFRK